jgi:hypothetical protein
MTTRHPAMLLGLPATSAPPVPRIARASILAWTRAALVRMWERRRLAELDDRANHSGGCDRWLTGIDDVRARCEITESVGGGTPASPRHGARRRTIHDLQCRVGQSRGWCAFAHHDAVGNAFANCSTYSVTPP